MKEIPYLFKRHMVQALLNGTKGETRRTRGLEEINENPGDWEFERITEIKGVKFAEFKNKINHHCEYVKLPCVPGDQIWVKETFRSVANDSGSYFDYKADHEKPLKNGRWKPSLFMPKAACRIWREVTDCYPERLNEISEQDAINEGIEQVATPKSIVKFHWKNYGYPKPEGERYGYDFQTPIQSYASLWESINGPGTFDSK
jgi:hypothetical protein